MVLMVPSAGTCAPNRYLLNGSPASHQDTQPRTAILTSACTWRCTQSSPRCTVAHCSTRHLSLVALFGRALLSGSLLPPAAASDRALSRLF